MIRKPQGASFLTIALVTLATTFCCCLSNFSANAQEHSLRVVASPPVKLHNNLWSVKYALMNHNATSIRFATFTCSIWDNWKISGKDFFIPSGGCRANILQQHQLDSGEQLSGELNVQPNPHLEPGSHTFRLIFTPYTSNSSEPKPQTLTSISSNEIKAITD